MTVIKMVILPKFSVTVMELDRLP